LLILAGVGGLAAIAAMVYIYKQVQNPTLNKTTDADGNPVYVDSYGGGEYPQGEAVS
jgi:hypothetical protein